jgi:hypothetical protein
MALWDKLRQELDRAGRAAQGALDEGKVRLEAYRARQLADKAAQALGYALFRARQAGKDLDTDSYARLSSTIAAREADAARYESQLRDIAGRRRGGAGASAGPAAGEGAGTSGPPAPVPPTSAPPSAPPAVEPTSEPHQPI